MKANNTIEEQDIREMCMSMSCQSGVARWVAGCLPMCTEEVPKTKKGSKWPTNNF